MDCAEAISPASNTIQVLPFLVNSIVVGTLNAVALKAVPFMKAWVNSVSSPNEFLKLEDDFGMRGSRLYAPRDELIRAEATVPALRLLAS